jgi:myo-inositol-1(or 4)-monophosphatase
MSSKIRLSQNQKDKISRAALEACWASGELLTRYYLGKAVNAKKLKGPNDLVTTADLDSCRLFKRLLKKEFPEHSFLFEETEFSENNSSSFLWIIDPLDGTTFHNRGLPFFSNMLALQLEGRVELGISYSPISEDLFMAWRGQGTWHLNRRFRFRRRARVSRLRTLDAALVGYSYGKTQAHAEGMASLLSVLFPKCRAIARLGGAEIGYVASGACEAFIDNSSTPWDFAGIALMVEEAGGRATDFCGRRWTTESKNIIVSNSSLHRQLLDQIQ